MSKLLPLVIFTFFIVGCATSKLIAVTSLDRTEKTITIGAGGYGLKGKIKEVLRGEGWNIVTDAGPQRTVGRVGNDVDLKTFNTFRSRYRMDIEARQYDICVPGFDPAYNYSLAVIDNQTGNEIMTLAGRDCEHEIIEKFLDWLRGK